MMQQEVLNQNSVNNPYAKWIKFDLKRRKAHQQQILYKYSIEKRKPSFSLSSDACRSPQKKQTKCFDNQNPGNSYFWNLIRPAFNEEKIEFIEHLRDLPRLDINEIDEILQKLLKLVDYHPYEDEQLLGQLENYHSNNQILEGKDIKLLVWMVSKIGLSHNKWKEISAVLQRNVNDVKQQWNNLLQSQQITQLWSLQEDQTLQSMVLTYLSNKQSINWKCMANVLNKGYKLCKDRWYNNLDPSLCKDQFQIEEDLMILQQVLKFGKRWHKIQREWGLNRKRCRQDLKKRFYELLNLQDSGYESDTSSQSQKKHSRICNEEELKIREMIIELKKKVEMQLEVKTIPRDKLLKNKLLNIAKSDLDKMINQQRKIKIQSTSPLENCNSDIYPIHEDNCIEEQITGTPLQINNLSRCLLNIKLQEDDDRLSIEKPIKQQINLTVESIENLKHEDLSIIQFALVNEKNSTIHYTNIEFMQQLLNLVTNQRKLMSLTEVKGGHKSKPPQRQKKFSSQQLIQVHPTEYKRSQFFQGDDKQI